MRILALSAHPDDETLGCGGTLLRHRREGDKIDWLIATRAHWPRWPRETVARKEEEIAAVARAYGARVHRLGFPAARLDRAPREEVMAGVEAAVRRARPEVVYMVHRGDVHSDHRALFDGAMAVLKTFRMRALGVRRVLSYETLSSTEAAPARPADAFLPTVYRDISGLVDRKVKVLGLYRSEVQSPLMPRGASAVRALARVRGAAIGVEAAEAFSLVREVG